jgi:hypothetical protein
MLRGPLHSSNRPGVERSFPCAQVHLSVFPPIGEKESYEKNTSAVFAVSNSVVS